MNVTATLAENMRGIKFEKERIDQEKRQLYELRLAQANHLHRALKEVEKSGAKLSSGNPPEFIREESNTDFRFSLVEHPYTCIVLRKSDGCFIVLDSGRGNLQTQSFEEALEFYLVDVALCMDLNHIPEEQ